jgi:NAD(P)-dependent dehydrogenase (short-subunit alcohol dehydrogenase family)
MSYKPFDLSGKVALVTGGNGGIGLGMADAIAQAGGAVAIWGTNEEKNAKAAAQLKAHGVKVYARKVNVANEQEVIDGIDATVKELGRIDSVFANAGVGFGSPSFVEMKTETYRKTLAVNLDGVFWTLRETCRHMVDRAKSGDTGGSLVGIASLAAIEGAARNQA